MSKNKKTIFGAVALLIAIGFIGAFAPDPSQKQRDLGAEYQADCTWSNDKPGACSTQAFYELAGLVLRDCDADIVIHGKTFKCSNKK